MNEQQDNIDWHAASLPGIDGSTVAIVLGAGGAIGGATASALAALGAKVAIVTRDIDRSTQIVKSIGASQPLLPAVADMSEPGSLEQMTDQVTDQMGTPTVLVNAAAIGAPRRDVTKVSRDVVSRILDVNVVGAYEAIKAVAPAMRAAGYGRIINTASVAAIRSTPGGVAYGVSKTAVIGLTEQMAVELASGGITVNCVSPGQTPTKLRSIDEAAGSPQESADGSNNASAIPLGRRGRLDDYVGAILFLSSALSGYITGMDIQVEGGVRLVRPKSF